MCYTVDVLETLLRRIERSVGGMKICRSGRVIKKRRKDKVFLFLRLNFVDPEADGKKKYTSKDILTGLEDSRKNVIKANAMLDNAITEYSSDSQRIYFHNYIQGWLEERRVSLEETTYQNYRYRIKIITSYFSVQRVWLTLLKPEHIHDFYNYLLSAEYKTGSGRKKRYSNTTIKDVAVILRMSLEDAVLMKYISESPAKRVKVPKRVTDIQRTAYIGVDEIHVFLDAIRGHRLETAFLLALYFGLRREEILGIRWSAIRRGKLYIEHTVTITDHIIKKDRTKSGGSCRCYPVLPEISDRLERIKEKQSENRRLFGREYIESDYVFTWEDGRLYSPDYLTKSFKKLVRNDDRLDDTLTLHSLRASCVSILVHKGMDIKDVQTWVGHKDVQTTLNVYARTNEKQQAKVADAMADVFFKRATDNS